jgi:putative N6-adenine-specific DNA methylase
MKILLTCFPGTAPVLNLECKHLWYKPFDQFDTGLYVEGERADVYKLNLRSRIASKVYVELEKSFVSDFDQLFDVIQDMNWEPYIRPNQHISIKAATHESLLHAPRTIQSVAHKAILTKLVGKNTQRVTEESEWQAEVFVSIVQNMASIRINTSGDSLHNRGYRLEQGEAPLKESLAASIVRMSGRHFSHPLLDPLCGSGTIVIEAAMMAKNIAPGLRRNFACEKFTCCNPDEFKKIKADAHERIFSSTYDIQGYDIDPEVLEKAKHNAERAGVSDAITFSIQDITTIQTFKGFVVSNPPYGKRIETGLLMQLYGSLTNLFKTGTKWCFISWRNGVHQFDISCKEKFINNNGEECIVYVWG